MHAVKMLSGPTSWHVRSYLLVQAGSYKLARGHFADFAIVVSGDVLVTQIVFGVLMHSQ